MSTDSCLFRCYYWQNKSSIDKDLLSCNTDLTVQPAEGRLKLYPTATTVLRRLSTTILCIQIKAASRLLAIAVLVAQWQNVLKYYMI